MTGQAVHNTIAFFSFVATALNLVLAGYVLYKNPRRPENRLFALVALSLAVWAFGDGAYQLSHSVEAWKFWVRFQAPGAILFPVLFLHLALVFTRPDWLSERGRSLLAGVLYVPALLTLAAFYGTGWVFRFKPFPAETLTIKGWLYWGYASFSYVVLAAALGLYIYNYYRSNRFREKRIAQIMVAAVAIPLVINILETARLYTLSSTPSFFTISAAVFAYGILKHQMFVEVEQVLRRTIVYGILTVLISSVYILTIVISEQFVSTFFSTQGYVITALFVTALVVVFEPLRSRLMKAVDRVFFKKDYEYARMLASLAESLTELSSLDDISRRIIETLTGSMGLAGAALLYEPQSSGENGDAYGKRCACGFVPGCAEGTSPAVRLEDGALYVSPGEVGGQTRDNTGKPPDASAEIKTVVLLIPLVFQREEVGVLALGEKLSGYPFSFSDRALLSAMAPQMAAALKNGALYQEVLEKQRRVNDLVEQVANAHEEERRKIARDLHDGVAQSFLGVLYLSEFTRETLEADLDRARKDLDRLTAQSRAGLEELRAVINDLRPIPLEVLGLRGAVLKLADDMCAKGAFECSLETNLEEGERLPALVEGNLYRIVQEALNNARKHAEAKHVRVRLNKWDHAPPAASSITAGPSGGSSPVNAPRIVLDVEDDGRGMPSEMRIAAIRGLGMCSMRQRAGEMGGELELVSEANKGTLVRVMVPFSQPVGATPADIKADLDTN